MDRKPPPPYASRSLEMSQPIVSHHKRDQILGSMSFFSYQTHVIRFIIVPPLSLTSLSRKPVAPPVFDESGVGVVVGSFDVFLNSTCLLLHKQDDMLLARVTLASDQCSQM